METQPGFVHLMPHFQVLCNASATLLLLCGGYMIKVKKDKETHKKCMAAALVASGLFLASYLTYHFFAGTFKFGGEGAVRSVYFFILGSHTLLSLVALPLIIMSFARALKGNFEGHKKVAHWTLPIWLYVSVTGVVIYVMLYHMYPGSY